MTGRILASAVVSIWRKITSRTFLAALVGIGLLVALWVVASQRQWLDPTLIAKPSEIWAVVLKAFAPDAVRSEQFHVHAYHTIATAFRGWGLALAIGAAIGLVLGKWIVLYNGGEPVIEFFRAIPPVLAFPLFLVAFDYERAAYSWTVFFGCLPVVILTVSRGAMGTSKEPFELMRAHGTSQLARVAAGCIELLPVLFLAARISFSIALIIAVVTEMVMSPRNGWALGALARDAEIEFDTPLFYACVLTIGLFGYGVNVLMRVIEQRLHPNENHALT
jgi:NitT/TauT family transport system permease protein